MKDNKSYCKKELVKIKKLASFTMSWMMVGRLRQMTDIIMTISSSIIFCDKAPICLLFHMTGEFCHCRVENPYYQLRKANAGNLAANTPTRGYGK